MCIRDRRTSINTPSPTATWSPDAARRPPLISRLRSLRSCREPNRKNSFRNRFIIDQGDRRRCFIENVDFDVSSCRILKDTRDWKLPGCLCVLSHQRSVWQSLAAISLLSKLISLLRNRLLITAPLRWLKMPLWISICFYFVNYSLMPRSAILWDNTDLCPFWYNFDMLRCV